MAILALISPVDPGTSARVDVRLSSTQDVTATAAAGEIWWPAISGEPTLQLSLFDGDFTSAVEPGSAQIELRLDVLVQSGRFDNVLDYDWAGAKVTLYRLVDGAPTELAVMKVERFAAEDYKLALALVIDEEPLQADVLSATYAGTTGAEGGADLKGQVKPWVFGRALNVEPVFIDQIDNVFQVSGYGPVQAIPAVYERGASFGASVGDFANYAALVAAVIPEGAWGTCLAQGMFRLGAPPAGVITCDVDGDNGGGFLRRTGAILNEIADRLSLTAFIDGASLAALDAAVARNVNIVISEQTSFLDLARRMAAPCNAVAGLGLDGRLIAPRVVFGSESITLDAQGRQMPPVLGMARQNTQPPYKRIQLGAGRSWRVHTFDEIAFYAQLIDRGPYDAATVYREGDIVTMPDSSRWIYVSLTPTAGNTPVAGSAFWEPLAGDGGIVTERFPTAFPPNPPIGSLYFDELNRPYRYEESELFFVADQLFFVADPLESPGWVLVQDRSLALSIEALQQVDDDGFLTVDEKIRIVIPEDSRLEAAYQGTLSQATALGLTLSAMTAARAAWIALRDGLVPAWNDITQSTPIVRADWDSVLSAYRVALEEGRAAVTSPGSVSVVAPVQQIIRKDAAGNTISGQLPRTLTPIVKRGATDIRTSNDVTYSITTTNVTATINNTGGSADKGRITVTAAGQGSIDLTVTVSGIAYGPFTIPFVVQSESSATFSANTYSFEVPLPNGDIILYQGGNDTVSGNSSTFYTFPVAYSVAPVVTVSGNSSDTSREGNAGLVGNPSTTGFTANNSTAVSITINWQAVGKK